MRQVLSAFIMGILPWKRSGGLARAALALDPYNLNALRVLYLKTNKAHSVMGRLEKCLQLGLHNPALSQLVERYFFHCRAQQFQELHFLNAFPKYELEPGFFVEIGVGDGVHLSNTYLFEKALGWSGLLVEANPECWATIRERRSAPLDTRAAWKEGGRLLKFICTATPEFSGLSESVRINAPHSELGEIDVQTARTEDIFTDNNVPDHIAFMSVDTEGSELEILRGIDFSRRSFDFLCVEHNKEGAKKERLISFFAQYGYAPIMTETSGNDFWFVQHGMPVSTVVDTGSEVVSL
ncbi:FkbM family methyltransferase [Pseudovibrio sp. Tun.PSC04-5.I4]|uniref:FkbM family methyltransferase n=1 Tax=Pseudovibrio sp. Tun.PSC04-5.I4 TaxID=1798213 RepID=UPI00088701B0|nr:FkbM family methyltransferase [Pseudovibrio sp. Tun.PSC04-5.I4]SDR12008.1 methyltransferase, FkbM family [Pseudovibrio sp. Tun.PSC04-5.I4]